MVERLARNLRDCRASEKATIWRGDVESRLAAWLDETAGTIDVAFVDPPYATAREWWPESPSREGAEGELPVLTHRASVIEAIFAPLAGKLAEDGVVVLRTDDKAAVPETLGPLTVARTRTYGNMVLKLLTKTTQDEKQQMNHEDHKEHGEES